ncbi:MAG: MarR family winged helix-turn-helix transcriptional regulator [Pseudonocardiaceae bacterium]
MSNEPETDSYPIESTLAVSAAEIAAAWQRELPGTQTGSILVITPLWRVAKTLADERRRLLQLLDVEPATLDLLSTLRRAGEPYELTTRQITERTLVTAGAVSQRIARAERAGLVTRSSSPASRRAVAVTLTAAGHHLIESTVRDLLAHEAALISTLDQSEQVALGTLLARLHDDLSNR